MKASIVRALSLLGLISLVPGCCTVRYWYIHESCGMSLPNSIPSRKYWLPMFEVRVSHFGSCTSAGGLVGLKLTWQNAQDMPTL